MDRCRVNIAIIEPSDIIYEGLTNILLRGGAHFYVIRLSDFDDFELYVEKHSLDIVIINPIVVVNRVNDFIKLKRSVQSVSWVGLIYSIYDSDIISKFDELINLIDNWSLINNKIGSIVDRCNCNDSRQEDLTERETAVLILLTEGLSNKEIADNLNISVHTVISHRRNIIEKTGIKSLPGLTLYAISKKIIPFNRSV